MGTFSSFFSLIHFVMRLGKIKLKWQFSGDHVNPVQNGSGPVKFDFIVKFDWPPLGTGNPK